VTLLRTILTPYARAVLWIERISMAIAGTCFIAIAVITGIDVAMRYVFSAPLVWAYELISDYLMVAVFFLSIGATQRHGQNIGVDILARRLPERLRSALAAVMLLMMAGFIFLTGSASWDVFSDAWESGDVLAGVIPWPRWPALMLVPLGCCLLLLRLVADLIGNVAAVGGDTALAVHHRTRTQHGMGLE
jgi:TRAP-type C4-dicarboxylate transport system permease small subunit